MGRFSYDGPPKDALIKGTCDDINMQMSSFGKNQIVLTLVDVHQVDTAGNEREVATRPVFISAGGKAGNIFRATTLDVLGIPRTIEIDGKRKAAPIVTEMYVGKEIALEVNYEEFELPDGTKGEMPLYSVTALEGAVTDVDDDTVAQAIVGYTPTEVFKEVRKQFKGTPFFALLSNKAKVLEYFADVSLDEENRYQLA